MKQKLLLALTVIATILPSVARAETGKTLPPPPPVVMDVRPCIIC